MRETERVGRRRLTPSRTRAIWLAVGLVAIGCGGRATPEEQIAPGQREFRATCAMCHGPNGEGTRLMGKDLRNNEFVAGRSDAELVKFLKKGRSASHPENQRGIEMPPKGGNPTLTDADLEAIVAYLRSIQ